MKGSERRAAGADDADFEAYAAARYTPWVRAGVLQGLTVADAEDAAQTALTKVWINWGRVSAARSPDAYAYKVFANQVSSQRRRMFHQPVASGDAELLDNADRARTHDSDELDRTVVMWAALESLSDSHRQILILRHYLGLSEASAAAALRIPRGTAKSRCKRAIEKLGSNQSIIELWSQEESNKR